MNKKISPDFRSIARHLHQVFQDRKDREAAKLVQAEVQDHIYGADEPCVEGYEAYSRFYCYEDDSQRILCDWN